VDSVILIVRDKSCELDNLSARILATTLLSGPATARESLGLLLREIARGHINGPLAIDCEEHENALRLALGEIVHDGLGSRSLSALRRALDARLVPT